jgi:hypothetical protein
VPPSGEAVYLDSSALVKLVIREDETQALRGYLRSRPVLVSCALARMEVPRAVRRHGPRSLQRADELLLGLALMRLDDRVLDAAAGLESPSLRSLDAIHVAAARSLGPDLAALVTYDERMAAEAGALGLPVVSPAS